MNKAVLLVTFNRLDCLKEVFRAVKQAQPQRLYISSDGPRENVDGEKEKVEEIRKWLLDNVDWNCEVKTRFLDKNSGGCCNGVSGAITWLFENEEAGIILEDDCVPNQSFFKYCEELLDKYKDNKQIWHIAGQAPIDADIEDTYYFSKIMLCWGWATWADRWKNFNKDLTKFPNKKFKNFSANKNVIKHWKNIRKNLINNTLDSWASRWAFNITENEGFCTIPSKPLISNIGYNGCHAVNDENNPNLNKKTVDFETIKHPAEIKFNEELTNRIYQEAFYIDLNKHFDIKDFNIFKFVFSIDNAYSGNKKYKVITLFGIKIKIKVNNK